MGWYQAMLYLTNFPCFSSQTCCYNTIPSCLPLKRSHATQIRLVLREPAYEFKSLSYVPLTGISLSIFLWMLGAGTMERQQGTRSEWERTERQASRMSERGERVPRETTKRKKCRRTLPYCQTLLIWPGHLHQPNQSPSHGNWFIRKGLPGQKRRSCIISTCCLHIICIEWMGGGRGIFLDLARW